MGTEHVSRTARLRRLRRAKPLVLSVVLAAAITAPLAASAGAAPTGGSAAVPPPGRTAVARSTPAQGPGETHAVTLLTGDVAVLHIAPGGRQSAWIEHPAHPGADGAGAADLRAGRAGARRAGRGGALSRLRSAGQEPVQRVVAGQGGIRRRGAVHRSRSCCSHSTAGRRIAAPATPNGSRRCARSTASRQFRSTADKARIRTVWDSLRGAAPGARLGRRRRGSPPPARSGSTAWSRRRSQYGADSDRGAGGVGGRLRRHRRACRRTRHRL